MTAARMPVGVAVFVPDGFGRYLMLRRTGAHGDGLWATPGGWVELGEDPSDTVVRECKEEIGVDVTKSQFIDYTHDIFPEGVEDVCLWFVANRWYGDERIAEPHKATDLKWMSPIEIMALKDEAFGGSGRMDEIIMTMYGRNIHRREGTFELSSTV